MVGEGGGKRNDLTLWVLQPCSSLDKWEQNRDRKSDRDREREMKMTATGCVVDGGGSGGGSVQSSCRSFTGSVSKPSWLQNILSDLDEKMKTLALTLTEEEDFDSFANRAENYYRKRPQLLNLLQDLYNDYLSLADRYVQILSKHPHQNPSPISTVHSDIEDDVIESDAESSLSYQNPPPPTNQIQNQNPSSQSTDNLIAELVIKTIDYEILVHETGLLDRQCSESSRKMELQKSLVEVLESERLILLNENARLGYKMTNLIEENKGLVSESVFMKRKATELARCVLKMREDHRVCMLSRKIEDLQGQIYGLEKRNKEYYEKLVRREEEVKEKKREMALEVCFEVEKLKIENQRLKEEANMKMMKKKGKEGWWGRVKKVDMFCLCVPTNPRFTSC
ncbi:KIP1-like [Macleaya cordata]|uniref:KIP1-like n=1 Tax=Macleaya cordata TaxID=56857 RepID=A0A200Q8I5_MACCD|nr:KIP1-like [Macleaya cordata]